MYTFLLGFLSATVLSACLTLLFRKVAISLDIVDRPTEARKIHTQPIPYLGGVAIFLTLILLWLSFLPLSKAMLGVILGMSLLFLVGLIDDIHPIPVFPRLLAQCCSAIILILSGIGITSITLPFGGFLALDRIEYPLFSGHISLFADLFTLLWVVGMINTLNFLDGLDGLASGISSISGIILFALSLLPFVNQPDIALMSLIFAGATLGFTFFNFHPAKIFMGDAGSQVLGFALAAIAIMADGKIATTLLVLGLPIIDVAWTIFRRAILEKGSPFKADKKHFHHRLLSVGLSHRAAVLRMYLFCFLFGLTALFTNANSKLVLLILLSLGFLSWSYLLSYKRYLSDLLTESKKTIRNIKE